MATALLGRRERVSISICAMELTELNIGPGECTQCISVLCYGCRAAKTLLLIAVDLERCYPSDAAMLKRADMLREMATEWLADTTERVVGAMQVRIK